MDDTALPDHGAARPGSTGEAQDRHPAGAGPTELLEATLLEIKHVIVGQDELVERLLVALLARGHCLLEGAPGVAKTLAVQTLAAVCGGSFARVQFTPDLVPADIVGTRIYRPSVESFDVELGPVFANFVLADEINRAPAKVQSALLEAMAERHVSIGGTTYDVPDPFLVLATQNPLEFDGVYPLPEAQRDRFLLKVNVPYPSAADELSILTRMGRASDVPVARGLLGPEQVIGLQRLAEAVFVHPGVSDYVVRLVVATRDLPAVGLAELDGVLDYGASPRATLGLVAAGRALALLRGRGYVLPGDVADVAADVLAHRVGLSFDALADGVAARDVVARVMDAVPQPRIAPAQPLPHDPAVGRVPA
jgi:MoxR-like ATPase